VFSEVRKQLKAKLVMIGDGPEKAGAEHLARELGIDRDVLFLGNQDCMEELLPLADIFLLPSSSESFGLVALEAMSAEVPAGAPGRAGEIQRGRDGGPLHPGVRLPALTACSENGVGWRSWPKAASRRSTARPPSACSATGPTKWLRSSTRPAPGEPRKRAS